MLDPVSVALKFGFLLVLYLFLLWIARSALKDLRRGVATSAGPASGPLPVQAPDATGVHRTGDTPLLVVESAPGHTPGSRYDVSGGAVIGRGDVEIVLEDTFASTRHAKVDRQGAAVVLEDLGSTNGTYLNDELLRGPAPLHPGDRIRIGDSVFTFQG
jgi:FHA domain